jgi:hypothetical protein
MIHRRIAELVATPSQNLALRYAWPSVWFGLLSSINVARLDAITLRTIQQTINEVAAVIIGLTFS